MVKSKPSKHSQQSRNPYALKRVHTHHHHSHHDHSHHDHSHHDHSHKSKHSLHRHNKAKSRHKEGQYDHTARRLAQTDDIIANTAAAAVAAAAEHKSKDKLTIGFVVRLKNRAKKVFKRKKEPGPKRKRQHEIDEEKVNEFKRITKERINYVSLLVKEDRIKEQDIPLPATRAGTTGERVRCWQNCCKKKKNLELDTKPSVSNADSDYEVKITVQQWRSNFFTKAAVVALAFSASNAFHFPYDCYKYGGSLFFATYMLLMMVLMQPLIYFEMLIGQFSQSGVSGFAEFHRYAHGLPKAITFMSLVFVPYNDMVLGYAGAYAVGATYTDASVCTESWNRLELCFPYHKIKRTDNKLPGSPEIYFDNGTTRTGLLSSELYFRQYIMTRHWSGQPTDIFGGWNPKVMIGFSVAYIIVFVCTMDYLTSKCSKAIVILSWLVPLSLGALIVSQFLCDGSVTGLYDFLAPDWYHLKDYAFWVDVFRYSFTTVMVGYGLFPRISSKNAFNFGQLYRTSWLVCLLTGLLCALASMVAFTELGIIMHAFKLADYQKIFAERTGISFITVSGSLMKLGRRWPKIVFFTIFNIGGIWPQIVATENCLTFVVGWLPRRKISLKTLRRLGLLLVISTQCLCALLTSKAGVHMLDSPQLFDGSWPAGFVALTEVFVVIYLYGFKLFIIDIEIMLKQSPPKLFQFQLKYLCPFLLLVGLTFQTIDYIKRPTHRYLGTVPSPKWLSTVGFILNLIPALLVLGFGLYATFKAKDPKQDKHKKKFRPGEEHIAEMFKRLHHRRGNLFEEAVKTQESRPDNQLVAFERRYLIYLNLKEQLQKLMTRRRAIGRWQTILNRHLIVEKKLNTLWKFVKWTLREQQAVKNKKDSGYIQKVLDCISLENLFWSSELEDHGNAAEDLRHIVDRHLESVSKSKLGFTYQPMSTYQTLVGKRNPVPDEDKLRIIIRIKEQMKLPTQRHRQALDRVIQMEDEKCHRLSVYREPPPVQFYFKHLTQHLRVIMVKGEDHSFLKGLIPPRPEVLYIPSTEFEYSLSKDAMDFVKKFVISRMKKTGFSMFKALALLAPSTVSVPALAAVLAAQPKATRLHLEDSKAFMELPNWFYGADLKLYKIDPKETYVVVSQNDPKIEKEKSVLHWIYSSEKRKIWPDYTVEMKAGVHPATLLEYLKFDDLTTRRQNMLALPNDIIHHPLRYEYRQQDEEWGLVSDSSSSSTSSSSSSDYPVVKTFSGSSFGSGWSSYLQSGSGSGSSTGSGDTRSGSPGSGDYRRHPSRRQTPDPQNPRTFTRGSNGSRISQNISATDLRYLQEHLKPKHHTLLLYPPKVNSQTALDEAKANVFGELARSNSEPEIEHILKSKHKHERELEIETLISEPNLEIDSILSPKDKQRRPTKSKHLRFLDNADKPKQDLTSPSISISGIFEVKKHQKKIKKQKEPKEKEAPKGRRQPSLVLVESEGSLWSSSSSSASADSFVIPQFSQEWIKARKGSRTSILSLWSQSSITAQVLGTTGQRRNSRARVVHTVAHNYTRNTKLHGWNECEQFIYRPQGKMLIVEKIEDSDPVVVWAEPGDSIASIGSQNLEDDFSKASIKTRHRNLLQARVLGPST